MTNPETPTTTPVPEDDAAYRAELLSRASLLGLSIHPMAKNSTIAAKIAAALEDKPDPEAKPDKAPAADPVALIEGDGKQAPPLMDELVLVKDKEVHPSKRLHRVIITCNDPQKADQSGDILSVSNGVIGNMRFYFHFNKPWHVPEIVLETLKESKLFLHSSRKDGREVVTREVPRYNIQYLPALTEKERHRIADKQAAALATED